MLVLIDNYDSFTYNLWHMLAVIDEDVRVFRNDRITVDGIKSINPDKIVLSPGPSNPDKAGICIELINEFSCSMVPILGVCLGHQAISRAFGGEVIRSPYLIHGQTSRIHHYKNSYLFENCPSGFKAMRYHSLIVDEKTLPDCLKVTAKTDDGIIMAMEHKKLPVFGLQFHPESIETKVGKLLIEQFMDI